LSVYFLSANAREDARMFERVTTGWELTKQSFRVLAADKELLLFPLMSGVACLLVLISFAVPLYNTPWFHQSFDEQEAPSSPIAYLILFAFYVVNYFVIVFFNAALVSCALKRMSGGDPTVGYGLHQAASRLPQIAAWVVVSATVGVVLRVIESKSEWVGKLMASLVGAAWAVATYFVVPILVVERLGPWDALKRSTDLIRRTWGEALVGKLGLGLILCAAMMPGIVMMMLAFVFAAASNQAIVAGIGVAAGVIWILSVSLVSSALQSILLTALYQYASAGAAPPQFDEALLKSAFAGRR
jgi:hypothetical protein